MSKVTESIARAWTLLRIARYRKRQEEIALSEVEAVDRLEQLENGGSPYGPRIMGLGGM